MIDMRALTYTYPQATEPALKALSWQVAAGEFVLLTGPSGSGKSTLLRCLNGLVPHFSGGRIKGQVMVKGLDVIAVGPRRMSREVGFVFQVPEAQAVLDRVEGEIAFALENSGLPAVEMRPRVEQALALLGLEQLRQRPLNTLSGGERQRVAVAAALVLQPQLLVLDEPTSQLDPEAAHTLLAALARLNRELGLTIVLAEHRLDRVLPYGRRLVFLQNGRIEIDGALPETMTHLPYTSTPLSTISSTTPTADASPLLDISNLHVAYGQRTILTSAYLQVYAGEVVALLGANGCGKTTLLRCVVGLLTTTAGEIVVQGQPTQGRSVADICREVAYLPQNPDDLLFSETVADELRLTLKNHNQPPSTAFIHDTLQQLGLVAYANTYPRDLSVGATAACCFGCSYDDPPSVVAAG